MRQGTRGYITLSYPTHGAPTSIDLSTLYQAATCLRLKFWWGIFDMFQGLCSFYFPGSIRCCVRW